MTKALGVSVGGVMMALLHSWIVVPANLEPAFVPEWVERIGWTLVHSVWQFATVAVVATVVHRILKRRSANARYVAAVTALGLMLVVAGVTWSVISIEPRVRLSHTIAEIVASAPTNERSRTEATSVDEAPRVNVNEQTLLGAEVLPHSRSDSFDVAARGVVAGVDAPSEPSRVDDSSLAAIRAASPWRRFVELSRAAVEPYLSWLVMLWVAGVVLCSFRPVWGLWTQWRLRRVGLLPVSDAVQRSLLDLARRMGLRRAVRIAESTLVRVPMVVGYLRPMILLPASVLTGLTPSQMEAVLAHELAHIRRHDWLVNAVQVMAETLFFFHPAVWWLSHLIRHERELCCDDIALSLIPDKAVFARTLLLLEELRQSTPLTRVDASSLAATGGNLVQRVRRLLPASPVDVPSTQTASFVGVIVMSTALILALGVFVASQQIIATEPPTVSQSASPDEEGLLNVVSPDDAGGASPREEPQDAPTMTEIEPRPDEQPKSDKPAKLEADNSRVRVVRVVDENEQPIQGASVRFQFEKEGTIFLNPLVALGWSAPKTNAKGETRESIPEGADRVHVTATAEGFGEFSEQQSASGRSTVTLKRGRVVLVRAVDEKQNVLKQAVPLLAQSRSWGREFVPQKDGTFKSPSVVLTRKLMRVAAAQADGPMLYSELIDVTKEKPGAEGVLQLTLKPGTRLEGKLDDSVPRPISEGYVELCLIEAENHTIGKDAWTWHDFTPVRPDGTFTFESLPSGGHAQLHVLVDGFISKNPTIDALRSDLREGNVADEETVTKLVEHLEHRAMWPQLVRLDQPQVNVTVPCEKTAS